MDQIINGNIVNIKGRQIFKASIIVSDSIIKDIVPNENLSEENLPYILPGFIDAHVHIESSMLVPSEFAKLAVVHGTVATVSDPHEIANVCGIEGVHFMIENGKTVPFKFHFGAPSCVPATIFETAGAKINSSDIDLLLQNPDIYYLSEMMNYPGVLNNDPEIISKINAAKKHRKPIDGHAPGLIGTEIKKYYDAGISTDHECSRIDEAREKLRLGMKILIREGSAAKNFDELIDLLNEWPDQMMFCSDDKHPDSLLNGHINLLCARAVTAGIDIFKVLQAACLNPIDHYKLRVGTLQFNDPADFILVNDLKDFKVIRNYINGQLVAENGNSLISTRPPAIINNFSCAEKKPEDFEKENLYFPSGINVIEALDGQLVTNNLVWYPKISDTKILADPENDILKIAVVNRYLNKPVSIGLVKNFGLKNGAIASSVAHDSHNIITVGTNDDALCHAVNLIIKYRGGISLYQKTDSGIEKNLILPLPIAGLMSAENGISVAEKYTQLDAETKKMGSKLSAPFMTLSFLALLVIPHLKLSDKGLFDVDTFSLLDQSI